MLYYTIIYYAMQYYTMLYYTTLRYTLLCYTTQYYIRSSYTELSTSVHVAYSLTLPCVREPRSMSWKAAGSSAASPCHIHQRHPESPRGHKSKQIVHRTPNREYPIGNTYISIYICMNVNKKRKHIYIYIYI